MKRKSQGRAEEFPAMSRIVSHKARMPNFASRVLSTLTWLHVLTAVYALDGNPEGTTSVFSLLGSCFANEALQGEA